MPQQPAYYTGPNGQLLVPAQGAHHRSNSASGYQQPAQVIINNDNQLAMMEEYGAGRPRSKHDSRHDHHRVTYYREDEYSDRERSRSRSRVRRRTPSPYYERESEYEIAIRLRRLDEMERKEEDERRKKRIEEELIVEAAKKEAAARARKKEEEELKKHAIEEYNKKQAEEKEKKKKAAEAADKEYRERMTKTLHANGYSDHEIEEILRKGDGKHHEHVHEHHSNEIIQVGHGGHGGHGHGPEIVHVHDHAMTVVPLNRPTHIKVNKKHLDIETLEFYQYPWHWDQASFPPLNFYLEIDDPDFIIIRQWVPEHEQEMLFEHTRKRRETRLMITRTELKKEHNQLLLVRKREHVRKKSPARH
ncbi:Actin-like protein 10 [Xylographa opegraphella]|nr:Actin-like protein 10 [Xylographa opegraphella]